MDNNYYQPNDNNNSSEFRRLDQNYTFVDDAPIKKKKKKESFHFGSRVVLPFACGVLGTTLVLGTCLYVPPVRKLVTAQLFGIEDKVSDNSNNNSGILDFFNTLTSDNKDLVSLSNLSETGVTVATAVQPSIVGITVEYSVNSVFGSSTASAEGSGIIISEDGYILTNNHVVNSTSSSSFYEVGKANKVTIYLFEDETPYEATIVGTDQQTDLAVLKMEKTGLPAAKLGDSSKVLVGEFAMAIGNPLGMKSSVTSGIVSAVGRTISDSEGTSYNLIQTDAAINSGNSGGALVNSKGEVIGVNFLKVSGTGVEGLGFAIPINEAKDIADQLINFNKVKRPYIGIEGIVLDATTAKRYNLVEGIYIRSIDDFSAAQRADLRIGDVIIELEGKKVKTMDEVNEIKNAHQIGDELTLKVYRSGEEKEIKLTLGEQP